VIAVRALPQTGERNAHSTTCERPRICVRFDANAASARNVAPRGLFAAG
jgi:hypothetical protein